MTVVLRPGPGRRTPRPPLRTRPLSVRIRRLRFSAPKPGLFRDPRVVQWEVRSQRCRGPLPPSVPPQSRRLKAASHLESAVTTSYFRKHEAPPPTPEGTPPAPPRRPGSCGGRVPRPGSQPPDPRPQVLLCAPAHQSAFSVGAGPWPPLGWRGAGSGVCGLRSPGRGLGRRPGSTGVRPLAAPLAQARDLAARAGEGGDERRCSVRGRTAPTVSGI